MISKFEEIQMILFLIYSPNFVHNYNKYAEQHQKVVNSNLTQIQLHQ